MLQSSAVTGFLFLIGVGINSFTMLLGCVLAILSSLAIAKLLEYDSDHVKKGFYGFNAALVGIAVFSFLPFSLISLTLVILGGALSALIMHMMMLKISCVPALTAPFILTIWMIILLIDFLGVSIINQGEVVPPISASHTDLLYGVFRGLGQVMLQGSWLSGVVFCCALLCSSYKAAIWGLLCVCLLHLRLVSPKKKLLSDSIASMAVWSPLLLLIVILKAIGLYSVLFHLLWCLRGALR